MNITAEQLGLTPEKLQELLLEKLADDFWSGRITDADSVKYDLQKHIETRVKEQVAKIAEEHVLPNVDGLLQTLTLKPTNRWGEPIKDAPCLTFREYLVLCAENYVNEQVDYSGKSKKEDSYNWSGRQTRIAWMIHEHLQYHIGTAVTNALKDLNTKVGGAIAETVKLQLNEALQKLKVNVTT